MRVLRDYHERVNTFICSRSPKAFTAAAFVVGAGLLLLVALFLWMGAPPMNGLPWDTGFLLDGGWRIFNGQSPHKDFFLGTGFLPLYVTSLGMKLGEKGVSSITDGNTVLMVALGTAALILLSRRTSAFYAALASVFIALLAVTPRGLGFPADSTDYSMVYNRYGEAFLALLGAVLFLPPDAESNGGWKDWVEAGVAGCGVVMLLFCKLNYFAVGIGFFILACLRGRFSVKHAIFAVLCAGAVLGAVLMLAKVPPGAMCDDYRIVLGTQRGGPHLLSFITQAAINSLRLGVLLFLAWEISRTRDNPRDSRGFLILVLIVYASAAFLISTNTQPTELPLLALAALVGAETIRRQTVRLAEDRFLAAARNAGAALILLFFILPTFGADVHALRYAASVTAQHGYFTPKSLRTTPLKDWRFCRSEFRSAQMKEFAQMLDEGMDLLRRRLTPDMRLTVFLFSNPYQVALNLPPLKGGVDCWSWIDATPDVHPPLKKMVGNATHILAIANSDSPLFDFDPVWGWTSCPMVGCKCFYRNEWDALHLEVVERTRNFTLYKVPQP